MKRPLRFLAGIAAGVLALVGCDSKDPMQPDSDPAVLAGDFAIRSQEDLNELVRLGGHSFSIAGDLSVEASPLVTLAGLENLTRIGGDLSIGSLGASNEALISLAGLESITSIGGFVSIFGNAALTSLTGLENLASIGGDLSIRRSGVLTDSSAQAFADRLVAGGFTGSVTVSGNQQ